MTHSHHHANTLRVRHALWGLQKEALAALKTEFDRENGYETTPTEWFQALMGAERYVWLREFTSLMADIDTLTELEFITDQHAAVARAEIERLLFEEPPHQSEFGKQFRQLLMSGTSLLPLHSQLKGHLQLLPEAEVSRDQGQVERRNWQEEHRHQARKKRN